jgi:hypothetical protein
VQVHVLRVRALDVKSHALLVHQTLVLSDIRLRQVVRVEFQRHLQALRLQQQALVGRGHLQVDGLAAIQPRHAVESAHMQAGADTRPDNQLLKLLLALIAHVVLPQRDVDHDARQIRAGLALARRRKVRAV